MIADAIGELVPQAQRLGVRLGVEALHPMFCADRCVISSLSEALDLALTFPADAVGVVVDTYHLWWDARLPDEIARAGPRIVSYQLADWVLPLPPDTLALVCGGLVPGCRDLGLARRMIADAIGELVPDAQRLGVRLGIEALHPMFCADRCVISGLGEALDLALRFPAGAVGVVVDTYHVWWDARLPDEIARAGSRIFSYQVCDWVLPLPQDTLLGRGHLGDGVIDFGPISASVTAAGYDGYVEVEIFNAEVWEAPPDQTAATVRERFAAVLGGR